MKFIQEQRIENPQNVRHACVVHTQRATLLIIGNCLDHRAEDVWIDLCPIERANVQEIRSSDLRELWDRSSLGR